MFRMYQRGSNKNTTINSKFNSRNGNCFSNSDTIGKVQIISRGIEGNEFGTINSFIALGNITSNGVIRNVTIWGDCLTAAATAAKTVTIPNYNLIRGDLLAIKFNLGTP